MAYLLVLNTTPAQLFHVYELRRFASLFGEASLAIKYIYIYVYIYNELKPSPRIKLNIQPNISTFSYPSVALLHQFSWIHHRRYCQANLLSKWSELISESEPAAPISLVGESECRRRKGFDADSRDLSSQSRGYLVTWYILEMG